MRRTSILSTILASGLVALAFSPQAVAQDLKRTLIASGYSRPLTAISPPGDTNRLFICEQHTGRIEIIQNGVQIAAPFLDLSGLSTGNEQGLLGLAFHPDYANNGRFFVHYSASGGGQTRLVEYGVSGNPMTNNVASPGAVQTIYTHNQPFSNHNGGHIEFSPVDGFLYLGLGDGGSGGDPQNNGQNLNTGLGKLLRFDVDGSAPFFAAGNPFGDEVWSYGLRNPYRWSFDSANGDIYIGDVGQNAWEEITFEPAGVGGINHGWRCREGAHNFSFSGSCSSATLNEPIRDYSHSFGCSITGGYVYRGSAILGLQGTYFYADYCTGRIWSFKYNGTTETEWQERTAELGGALGSLTSFGQDANGELYIVQQSGAIWRIEQDCGTATYCTAAPNSTGNGMVIGSGGSLSIAANNFILSASGGPNNEFGLFFYGAGQGQFAFGDGFRCVPGSIARLNPPVLTDNLFGDASRVCDFTSGPMASGPEAISAGSTWNFQFWYRDPGGPGGTGFNLTNGLSALFCP